MGLLYVIGLVSISIRRIRDIGLSGWWGVIYFPSAIFFYGVPALILGLLPSKKIETYYSFIYKTTLEKIKTNSNSVKEKSSNSPQSYTYKEPITHKRPVSNKRPFSNKKNVKKDTDYDFDMSDD